jgi:hypothetical protein
MTIDTTHTAASFFGQQSNHSGRIIAFGLTARQAGILMHQASAESSSSQTELTGGQFGSPGVWQQLAQMRYHAGCDSLVCLPGLSSQMRRTQHIVHLQ